MAGDDVAEVVTWVVTWVMTWHHSHIQEFSFLTLGLKSFLGEQKRESLYAHLKKSSKQGLNS